MPPMRHAGRANPLPCDVHQQTGCCRLPRVVRGLPLAGFSSESLEVGGLWLRQRELMPTWPLLLHQLQTRCSQQAVMRPRLGERQDLPQEHGVWPRRPAKAGRGTEAPPRVARTQPARARPYGTSLLMSAAPQQQHPPSARRLPGMSTPAGCLEGGCAIGTAAEDDELAPTRADHSGMQLRAESCRREWRRWRAGTGIDTLQ
jgi:hypothetical protein